MSPLGQNITTGIEVEEIENGKKKKAFLPSFLQKVSSCQGFTASLS